MGKVLFTALALWIPLIPMFIIMRRFLDGRNGTSRAKKSKNKERAPRVRFADVAGVDVAKRELEEVVSCLRDGRKFTRVGAKLPSGVLLCGPPGTGKTLLAKAVAGEAGVPFLSVAASEFVELFVGRGAARIRELFAEARKRSPCVVFIDELDAIGGKRGAGLNEERDQTLNQLLTELDGFDGRPGVVLLAATNRPEVLDAALLRPGRLSRKVNVPLPDVDGRAAIMRVHLRNIPVEDEEFAATAVARLTGGMSGAELANCVNEAAFMAARREADVVSMDDLSEAILRTRFGVNGSAAEIPSWSKRLNNWLMANASPPRTMRTPAACHIRAEADSEVPADADGLGAGKGRVPTPRAPSSWQPLAVLEPTPPVRPSLHLVRDALHLVPCTLREWCCATRAGTDDWGLREVEVWCEGFERGGGEWCCSLGCTGWRMHFRWWRAWGRVRRGRAGRGCRRSGSA